MSGLKLAELELELELELAPVTKSTMIRRSWSWIIRRSGGSHKSVWASCETEPIVARLLVYGIELMHKTTNDSFSIPIMPGIRLVLRSLVVRNVRNHLCQCLIMRRF